MKENEHDQLRGGQGGPLMADATVNFEASFSIFCMSDVIFRAYFMVNTVPECAWSVQVRY